MMVGSPVGFPVPRMQERLDKCEALDRFTLDYTDYCAVMGWFQPKDGYKFDNNGKDGKAQWKNLNLCVSTL